MNLKRIVSMYLMLNNLLVVLFVFNIDARTNNTSKLNQTCNYYEADVLYEKGKESQVRTAFCQIDGKLLEIIGIQNNNKEKLISGSSILMIPEIIVESESDKIYIPDGLSSHILIENSNDVYSAKIRSTGKKDVLVIRVIARDASTTRSASFLSNNIFGTNGDSFNMKSQFEACSHKSLIMRPYSGKTETGKIITNGVGEVTIGRKITGVDRFIIMNAVLEAVFVKYGDIAQFDHVMLCLPYGTADSESWIGYGLYNFYLTVFNDMWCDKPSLNIHEIGHNLNQMHSGTWESEYGDTSCLMGYSYNDGNYPKKCFNGAKSWSLGWYSMGHVTIDTQSISKPSFSGRLIGVNDYDKKNLGENKTIIRIKGIDKDYYVMFNLAKGINSDVYEGKNKVTITSRSNIPDPVLSLLEKNLGSGDKYIVPDTSYFVKVVKINLKAKKPYAQVSVSSIPQAPTRFPTPIPVSQTPTENPIIFAPFSLVDPFPISFSSPTSTSSPSFFHIPSSKPTINPTGKPTLKPTLNKKKKRNKKKKGKKNNRGKEKERSQGIEDP